MFQQKAARQILKAPVSESLLNNFADQQRATFLKEDSDTCVSREFCDIF